MGWKVELTCDQGCKHWIEAVDGWDIYITDNEKNAKDFAFSSVAYDLVDKLRKQGNYKGTYRIVPILFIVRTVQ